MTFTEEQMRRAAAEAGLEPARPAATASGFGDEAQRAALESGNAPALAGAAARLRRAADGPAPAAVATAFRYSDELGLPVPVIARNLDQVERERQAAAWQQTLSASPALAQAFNEINGLAELAHDDHAAVDGLTRIARDIGERYRDTGATGIARPIQGPAPTAWNTVTNLGGELGRSLEQMRAGLRAQFADAIGSETMLRRALRDAESADFRNELNRPAFESRLGSAVYAGFESTAQQAPGTAVALLVGPAAGLTYIGASTQTTAYTKYRGRGASREDAALGAGLEGLIEVGTEKLGMKYLTDNLGKKGIGEFLTGLLGREIPGEQIATFAEDAVDTAIANPDKTWSQYLAERPGRGFETLVATLTQTAFMGGLGEVAYRWSGAKASDEAARTNARLLQEGADIARGSELRKRAPDKFAELAGRLLGADEKAVYVPADAATKLFQSNPEAAAAFVQAVPGGAPAVELALAAGHDVAIPAGAYFAHLADFHAALAPDVRMGDAASLREAEAEMATLLASLKADYPAQTDALDTIRQDLIGQLTAAGTERGAAEAQAEVFAQTFGSLASRSGQDPVALWNRYNLQVGRDTPGVLARPDTPERLDMLLDRLRGGDIPSQQDAFGVSLLDFLRQQGGLQDDGGELAARDVDKGLKPFQKKLVQPGGLTLDDAAEKVMEAGYLPERDLDQLLAAISDELAGTPRYAVGRENADLVRLRDELTALQEYLGQRGIDLAGTDNGVIKERLRGDLKAHRATTALYGQEAVVAAREAGYEGEDSGEAREWLAAVAKGLDMSEGARMARAEALGFDTSRVYFHGTPDGNDIRAFDLGRTGGRTGTDERAVYVADDPMVAAAYAYQAETVLTGDQVEEIETGGSVLPIFVRPGRVFHVELAEGNYRREAFAAAVTEGRAGGYDVVDFGQVLDQPRDTPYPLTTAKVLAVLDPARLRSIHAAFDPDHLDSTNLLAQAAFHGTPHTFDRFSLSAIGTGEGAQAYGWGLYFAGKRSIAEYYRDALTPDPRDDVNRAIENLGPLPSDPRAASDEVMYELKRHPSLAAFVNDSQFKSDIVAVKQGTAADGSVSEEAIKAYRRLDRAMPAKLEGNLYQVDIPDDNELLDWDKPLNKQPAGVREKLKTAGIAVDSEKLAAFDDALFTALTEEGTTDLPVQPRNPSGEDVYKQLVRQRGSDQAASQYLSSLGIPGLRYLDGTSRDQGDGSHNYVIWDEDRVTVEAVNDELRQAETQAATDPTTLYQESPADLVAQPAQDGQRQTDTPAFRDWFGDSVVTHNGRPMSEGGRPMVMYHGTTAKAFDVFDTGAEGAHFGTSEQAASRIEKKRGGGGRVKSIAVYLSIKNPLRLPDIGVWSNFNNLHRELSVNDHITPKQADTVWEAWQRTDAAGWKALKDALAENGYDGIVYENDVEGSGDSYIAFRPEQIKSAIGNRGTFDPADPRILYQESPADLVAQHNISAEKLLHADKMGGLAVPSLAITKADHPMMNFGEITLLAPKEMVDPKGYAKARVFGADIYSPRYPTVSYHFTDNMTKRMEARLAAATQATGTPIEWSGIETNGARSLARQAPVLWETLRRAGLEPSVVKVEASPLGVALEPFAADTRRWDELEDDPAFIAAAWEDHRQMLAVANDNDTELADQEIADLKKKAEERGVNYIAREKAKLVKRHQQEVASAGRVDAARTRYALDEQVSEAALDGEAAAFAEELLRDIGPNERIFTGYTPSGNRRYIPHTLENVVKLLKKGLRGGEGFNYGVGSIRSAFTPQFKSIEAIRKAKGRLMDAAAFAKVKDEIDTEFFALVDRLRSSHSASDRFGFADTVSSTFYDAATMGIDRALRENGFEDVTDGAKEEIGQFLAKLRTLPTEYFEVKILRDVSLAEFHGAVVPEGTKPEVLAALKRAGITEVKTYKPGDDADRTRAVNEFQALLFQQVQETRRGYIRFGADRTFDIRLLQGADLSTVLHEAGHFFVEVMGDLAADPSAPAQLRADYATLRAWVGAEDGKALTVDQHEQIARGFEAYLMEGKAPSAELRGAFTKFRAWLLAIYRRVAALRVTLTPEVRGVFDRLVATDEAIAAAAQEVQLAPLWPDAQAAGMTPEAFAAYEKELAQARQEAEERLMAQANAQVRREAMAWWKARREAVRAEVEAEVNQRPAYVAQAVLSRGTLPGGAALPAGVSPVHLNRAILVERYGATFLKRLAKPYVYRKDGGVAPEVAADLFGFQTGQDLIDALASLPPRRQAIDAETDARMRERYGDLLTDGTLPEEAMAAVHSDRRAELLLQEVQALGRRAGRRPAPLTALRAEAHRIVGQQTRRALKPSVYLRAEQKAGREAFAAAAQGDHATAFVAKQRQLFNAELYRAARDAVADVDAAVRFLKRVDTTATRQRLGKAGDAYLDPVDTILERYELKTVPAAVVAERQTLLAWYNDQLAAGQEPVVDESVLRRLEQAQAVNFADVPVDELRGVRDTVRNILHLARQVNEWTAVGDARLYEEVRDAMVTRAEETQDKRPAAPIDPHTLGTLATIAGKLRGGDATLLRMEQVIDWLDGGDLTGPWRTYLWEPASRAQAEEADLHQTVTAQIVALLEAMPAKHRASLYDALPVRSIGQPLTRQAILAMALNLGTASNRQKLQRGGFLRNGERVEFSDAMIAEATGHLTAEDWALVQGVWDALEGLRPKIGDLEKRLTGLEPEWQVATPVVTPFGTLRGGYYPVVYDRRFSAAGAKQDGGPLFEEGYERATTPRGHTKARVEAFAAPIKLDLEVLPTHLAKVIKDLTHREFVLGANKLLADPAIKATLRERLGEEYADQFMPWLRRVVNDRNASTAQGLNWWARLARGARLNLSVVAMGFKATTMLSQLGGYSNSLDVVSGRHLAPAIGEFLRHPRTMAEFVRERSGEMRHRMTNLDRDLRDGLRRVMGRGDLRAQAQRFAFHGIGYMDMAVSVPTWVAAYRQELARQQADSEAANETLAIQAGDRAVRFSQGAGGAKDLAAVQSDNELMKLTTMFYSYFSALYSRLRDVGRTTRSVRDVPRMLARSWFLVVMPAILGELLAGRGPDDDEPAGGWVLRKVLTYPLMTVPVLRDIVAATDSGYGAQFTPLAQTEAAVSRLLVTTGQAIEDPDKADKALLAAFKASGYVLGLPTGQIGATGAYLQGIASGEINPSNPFEVVGGVLYGPPKDK